LRCPNCGREAINVNGKYVCLDCGVELSPNQTQSSSQAPTTDAPSISKYSGSGPLNNVPEETSVPAVTPPIALEPPIVEPPEAPDLPTPVKDEYINDLATKTEETSGSYDFSAKPEPVEATQSLDQGSSSEIVPTPMGSKPESYFQPESVDITPQKVEESVSVTTPEPIPTASFDVNSAVSNVPSGEPLINQLGTQEETPTSSRETTVVEPQHKSSLPMNQRQCNHR
jgi:hypothetical protein